MQNVKNSKGRVLCLTSNFPRWKGDSTTPFVLNLAEDLVTEGWAIDVLAPHAPKATKFERFNQVDVYRFQYLWPEQQQTICYQGGALVNLRKNPLNKLKLPLLVIAQFFALFKLLFTKKYDVIHAHWILPQGFNAVILGKLFKKRVVITVHGGDVFGLRGRFLEWLKTKILNAADVITVNSEFTKNAVLELSHNIKKLKKIPMGVDTTPLTASQKDEISDIKKQYKKDDGVLLVFVGRLVEEKGVSDLLYALAIILKRIPQATAVIAGEGQDKEQFIKLAQELQIQQSVYFVGWVDYKKVPLYMAAGDFFVGPSKKSVNGQVEAQGLTFLEAMAVGTIVIATASGGIKESVIDGETGFLVDESSPEQIAGAVLSSLGFKKHDEIKRAALNQVLKFYSRKFSAINISSIFKG
jgi:phosphatidylinositol alpha-1,6-mannosyltransferase